MDKPTGARKPSTDVASLRQRLEDLHEIKARVVLSAAPPASVLTTLDQLISELTLVLLRLDRPDQPHRAAKDGAGSGVTRPLGWRPADRACSTSPAEQVSTSQLTTTSSTRPQAGERV